MSFIDQFNDPAYGTLARQIARMPGLEGFVKHASLESSEASSLPDSAFAWPSERRYPLHTAEHTALSAAYAKVASYLPPHVEAAIDRAVEVYGIPASVLEETVEKVAADSEEDYLLPAQRLFRVKTAADVKRAESSVLANLTKLDLESRAIACGRLVEKAASFEVELHPAVMKLAGFVVSSTQELRSWLEARAEATPPTAHLQKVAYQTLADGLKKAPAELADRPGLLKLASTIAELDEQAGLDRHYDRKLPDALQTVFNTEKVATAHIDLGGGKLVPLAKLAAMPAAFWEDLGGPELSREVAPGGVVDASKLAEVVETLPLDLKVILKSQIGG